MDRQRRRFIERDKTLIFEDDLWHDIQNRSLMPCSLVDYFVALPDTVV